MYYHVVFTKGFEFWKQLLGGVLQKSEVKNPERARKSINLLKMNSVKGICVADLQRTISKNTFIGFFIFSYILQAAKFILFSFCRIFDNNLRKVILMVMINTSSFLQKNSQMFSSIQQVWKAATERCFLQIAVPKFQKSKNDNLYFQK